MNININEYTVYGNHENRIYQHQMQCFSYESMVVVVVVVERVSRKFLTCILYLYLNLRILIPKFFFSLSFSFTFTFAFV